MLPEVSLQNVAYVLSLITIFMGLIQKIPQILTLWKSKSAQGISFISLILELTSYSVTFSYNFTNGYSIFSYAEYPILLIEEYILIYLILKYLNLLNTRTLLAVIIYFSTFVGFVTQIIPKTFLTFLIPLCTPISASSKLAQLTAIIRAKNADTVSPGTWIISVLSNLARVFTTYMDSNDLSLMVNFITSVTLSTSIFCTIMYYNRRNAKKVD